MSERKVWFVPEESLQLVQLSELQSVERQRDELQSVLKSNAIFVLLEDLVEALDSTNWSSWQATHNFDVELDCAREFINSVKGGA